MGIGQPSHRTKVQCPAGVCCGTAAKTTNTNGFMVNDVCAQVVTAPVAPVAVQAAGAVMNPEPDTEGLKTTVVADAGAAATRPSSRAANIGTTRRAID